MNSKNDINVRHMSHNNMLKDKYKIILIKKKKDDAANKNSFYMKII